jgi:hypothetical protein
LDLALILTMVMTYNYLKDFFINPVEYIVIPGIKRVMVMDDKEFLIGKMPDKIIKIPITREAFFCQNCGTESAKQSG